MKNNILFIFVIALLIVSQNLLASDKGDFSDSDLQSHDSKSIKKINVKFDDEMVKGGSDKPDLEILMQRSNGNFKKLIRLRENFIPEIQKGKDDLRGGK